MCLLALLHRTSAEAPLMLAANREEAFDRPFDPPTLESGPPRVVCPHDRRAGGTWLGVNEHGLLVAVTNRPAAPMPDAPSRGSLARTLLQCDGASPAVERAMAELSAVAYAPCNFLIADRRDAFVVCHTGTTRAETLLPGLNVLANGDPNDPHDMRGQLLRECFARRYPRGPVEFLEFAPTILSLGLDATGERTIIVRHADRGTVCSTLLVVAEPRSQSVLRFAAGPPDVTPWLDYRAEMAALFRS